MRIAEWLTYTSMEQLRQISRTYHGEELITHSKYDLIRSLLPKLGRKGSYQEQLGKLSDIECRFLQLLVFDTSPSFTMEELLAKGRAALCQEEGEPRSLVVQAIKRGWLFQGYSHHTQYLYHVPSDTRNQMIDCFLSPFYEEVMIRPPLYYRDEEQQMIHDLKMFLEFLGKHIVRTTDGGGIYRNQLRQIMDTFSVSEELLNGRGPRFGFGRSYHLYPDRFSLLYDFAFYEKYLIEDSRGYLCLAEQNFGNISNTDEEGLILSLYRFWIRLYNRPIPNLPIILKWIGSLAHLGWFPVETIKKVVYPWIRPFYYETEESLFTRLLKMLAHLGVLKIGEESTGERFLTLTPTGIKIFSDVSAFQEKVIDVAFIQGRD
ncbi:hypothetical protein MK805_10895 [Shimazuella sp. AN120528]|uniref:hypothetical protein n=1 Tax=Shimazuella soli TaxID=1892854 RepID=UPI001F0FA4EB|nr:hypothetical protein [Shimazuella soli]MCH5585458.1 hypothetical protein [Shimazuella soli]